MTLTSITTPEARCRSRVIDPKHALELLSYTAAWKSSVENDNKTEKGTTHRPVRVTPSKEDESSRESPPPRDHENRGVDVAVFNRISFVGYHPRDVETSFTNTTLDSSTNRVATSNIPRSCSVGSTLSQLGEQQEETECSSSSDTETATATDTAPNSPCLLPVPGGTTTVAAAVQPIGMTVQAGTSQTSSLVPSSPVPNVIVKSLSGTGGCSGLQTLTVNNSILSSENNNNKLMTPVWKAAAVGHPGESRIVGASSSAGSSVAREQHQQQRRAVGTTTPTVISALPDGICLPSYQDLLANALQLQQQVVSKDGTIASLQGKVKLLEMKVDELKQLPTRKVSQIPIEDMIQIMHEYGSEISDTVMPPRKSCIQRASVVRQFRRWNPNFFQFFEFKDGHWMPKLGKHGELKRRVELRRQNARNKRKAS